MPHVIIKLATGKSEEQKVQLVNAMVKDTMEALHCGAEAVSVAIEEIKPKDWAEKVYRPEILNGQGKLYKPPGYTM